MPERAPSIRIRVLLFAHLARETGEREITLELPEHATVSDALERLAGQYPQVARMGQRLVSAVNMEYVKPRHRLSNGDELALIPPVSGG